MFTADGKTRNSIHNNITRAASGSSQQYDPQRHVDRLLTGGSPIVWAIGKAGRGLWTRTIVMHTGVVSH